MIDFNKEIEEFVSGNQWRIRENANGAGVSLQALHLHIAKMVIAQYLKTKLPKEALKAHKTAKVHIHDLGNASVYCCGWDTEYVKGEGIPQVQERVYTSPAKNVDGFMGQIMNLTFSLQNESAGAQSWNTFDTVCSSLIKDTDTYESVKQSLQGFIYNINLAIREGSQSCFSNISLDVIATEGHSQAKMDMFNKAFCELMIQGYGNGIPFTFPIPTLNVTKELLEHPSFKPFCELAAVKGSPYFTNFITSDLGPSDVTSMCCRLRLDRSELIKRGGMFNSRPMTGSIGVVTLSLPYIFSFKSHKKRLVITKSLLELARQTLNAKRALIEDWCEKGMYPYIKHYLQPFKDGHGSYFYNHFNTIGIVGGNEACLNLNKYNNIENSISIHAMQDIQTFILETIQQFQEEDGYLYNLEATPAESASHRLAKYDLKQKKKGKKRYKDMHIQGGDNPYYSNSTWLPADSEFGLLDKIAHQSRMNAAYSGGSVCHLYTETEMTEESVYNLIKHVFENYTLPYLSITPIFGFCSVHGKFMGKACPK